MNRTIIIDASVAAKWLLPDENDPIANIIKKKFADREIEISVPTLIFYEINNLLKSAVLSKRISINNSIEFYDNFLSLNFTVHWSKELLKNALQKALDFNISAYDAAYVVLAESLQVPFYTSDAKLVKQAKSPFVKLLADYS